MQNRYQYLTAMGIQPWVQRYPGSDVKQTDLTTAATAMDWAGLTSQVKQCQLCPLHAGRKHAVFGVGNQQADWMIIGEAPGAEEDSRGEPFVGRAGQLLTAMLHAIGLQREQVYIANVLKCRPPGNRDPNPDEIQQCLPYLQKQIAWLSPKIILLVGRIAAQTLLATDQRIGVLRGKVHQLPATEIPVIVTYHPAYLLRRPIEKRKAWADLQLAINVTQ